jgi:hypothetical protein
MTSSGAVVAGLQDVLAGRVMTPGDDGYDLARSVHNGAIDNHPLAVAEVAGSDDVAAVLRSARENDLSVSVKGGGHGVVGHATAGDLVIDLAALRQVRIDPAAKTATVGGGARWGDVDGPANEAGLAVPGGRITNTGVAGLTLGGGEGWLSSQFGLTIDSLVGVELVSADGRTVQVDAENEPDLFWALRGGGGNFGVVTEFRFALHEIGPAVLGGMLIYPLEAFPLVTEVLEELTATATDAWGGAMVVLSAPPLPFVPPEVVGQPVVAVVPAWSGDIDEGLRVITPLREKLSPAIDLVAPMPYPVLQGLIDEGNPDGLRNYWTSAFVTTPPSQFADTFMSAAEAFPTPFNNIIISPLRGAATRIPANDTAFPQRGEAWFVHPLGRGADPSGDAAVKAWAKDLIGALDKIEVSTYLNLDSDDSPTRIGFAFGDDRLARLQAVKRTWDPDNVFRHCANIAP